MADHMKLTAVHRKHEMERHEMAGRHQKSHHDMNMRHAEERGAMHRRQEQEMGGDAGTPSGTGETAMAPPAGAPQGAPAIQGAA